MLLHSCLLALLSCSSTLAATAADYYITSLPDLDWPAQNTLKMHAGHIELDAEHHGNMFFWHVANKHIAERRRTVIWLNGGPGCSSMDGLFLEMGPFKFSPDGKSLVEREGSWHESANLLFVDNPLGTGFSFVDTGSYLTELDQMADQFLHFMDEFIKLFPEYDRDDLYIAGESFAGQFIPYIAKAMLKRNEDPEARNINLQGILIGNGWIDPMTGYQSYLPYALSKDLIQEGSAQHDAVKVEVDRCTEAAKTSGYGIHLMQCENILNKILEVTLKKADDGQNVCINSYDVRKIDSYPACGMNWPSELTFTTPYLQRPDVVKAIHAQGLKKGWVECNGAVSGTFRARQSRPSSELIPQLVRQIPVLLFSGAQDLICNHLGTEEWLNKLDWNGYTGFDDGEHNEWTLRGKDIGFYKSSRNMTYVLFHEASHMVPYDDTYATLDMLERFMLVGEKYFDHPGTVGEPPAVGQPTTDVPTEGEAEGVPEKSLQEAERAAELKAERYKAYYKAGGGALVFILILTTALGYYIWKSRRNAQGQRKAKAGRHGSGNESDPDETELQGLTSEPIFDNEEVSEMDASFAIGGHEDSEDDVERYRVRRT